MTKRKGCSYASGAHRFRSKFRVLASCKECVIECGEKFIQFGVQPRKLTKPLRETVVIADEIDGRGVGQVHCGELHCTDDCVLVAVGLSVGERPVGRSPVSDVWCECSGLIEPRTGSQRHSVVCV